MTLNSTSGILYIRASLSPFADRIKCSGGVIAFLHQSFLFDEIIVPHFFSPRPFWRPTSHLPKVTNSGSLGKIVANDEQAFVDRHPTHSFAGVGQRVVSVLEMHDHNTSCFFPISELASRYDFSMLLLACVKESPGFSTVHAVQSELGLSRKHLIRHIVRWDIDSGDRPKSIKAKEAPGCSMSFDKFYPFYENDGNLIRGELFGKSYIFIKSAKKAMDVERQILRSNPRFVDCGNLMCPTCSFRLY